MTSRLSYFGSTLLKVSIESAHLSSFCMLTNCLLLWRYYIILGYYEVDVGLPLNGQGLRVMSIADLNNDKLNDLVMIDSTGTKATVYYFDDSSGTYAHNAEFTLPAGYTCDGVMPTAIPSQLQDLIVLASKVDSVSGDATETKLFYYT